MLRSATTAMWLAVWGGASVAAAGPSPASNRPDLVPPAQYRICVTLDKSTVSRIRWEIRREIRRAVAERQRQLQRSREELRRQLLRELRQLRKEWRTFDLRRPEARIDVARRARLIGRALFALELEKWRAMRSRNQAVSERALRRLERLLAQIKRREAAEIRERGRRVEPPHE